jgi:hypothetical protein
VKTPLTDDEFYELVDLYENGSIKSDDALDIILKHTNNYEVAEADFTLLVQRGITKEEKQKIKEALNEKNNKRGSKLNR